MFAHTMQGSEVYTYINRHKSEKNCNKTHWNQSLGQSNRRPQSNPKYSLEENIQFVMFSNYDVML